MKVSILIRVHRRLRPLVRRWTCSRHHTSLSCGSHHVEVNDANIEPSTHGGEERARGQASRGDGHVDRAIAQRGLHHRAGWYGLREMLSNRVAPVPEGLQQIRPLHGQEASHG